MSAPIPDDNQLALVVTASLQRATRLASPSSQKPSPEN
jgi:hypothetical protein